MSWSSKRQIIIVFILLILIGGAAFAHYRAKIFVPPTCTDGKMDGTEVGVDCGGSCTNFCSSQIKMPTVLWSRSFKVATSVYTAVASIQNQNDAAISAIPYEFRLYDDQGIYVARVDGTALVPPSGNYAIVETGIQTGNAVIGSTTFEFGTASVPWVRIDPDIEKLRLGTSNISLDTSGTIPKLSATLTNSSPTVTLRNIRVAAILYDVNGNAVTASKTFIPSVGAQQAAPVVFTWPQPITTPIVRYDILPVIDVFATTK